MMKKFPIWKSVIMMPHLFSKNINPSPYVEIIGAREFEQTTKMNWINLNGEFVKMCTRQHIRVVSQSFNMIVP